MVNLNGTLTKLRELTAEDAGEVYRLFGDDAVTRWLSFGSRSPEQCRELLHDVQDRARSVPRQEYYLAITLAEELIGFVRLGLTGVSAAKLGYAIRADSWGNGYATDAVRTVISFAFETLRLHRISAAVGPRNVASLAVLDKIEMKNEGRIRDHVFTNGQWRDSVLLSILSHEWSSSEQQTATVTERTTSVRSAPLDRPT